MAKEDLYPIERHAGETERLNFQNKFLNDAVGYHLHPIILRSLPKETPLTFAELATGSGAFLVDLSNQFPPASTFHGYDISSATFLPSDQLPQNVTLNVVDAREPPAAELRGKYDVVNMRFINVALTPPEDWIAVATHAFQLLKPGGALQWIEANLTQVGIILNSGPETKTTALEKATEQTIHKMGYMSWFIAHLSSILTDVGFRDVTRSITSTDRLLEGRKAMSHVAAGAVYGLLRRQAHSGVEGAPSEEEVEKMFEEMQSEIDGGAYFRADMYQYVAFKKGGVEMN